MQLHFAVAVCPSVSVYKPKGLSDVSSPLSTRFALSFHNTTRRIPSLSAIINVAYLPGFSPSKVRTGETAIKRPSTVTSFKPANKRLDARIPLLLMPFCSTLTPYLAAINLRRVSSPSNPPALVLSSRSFYKNLLLGNVGVFCENFLDDVLGGHFAPTR